MRCRYAKDSRSSREIWDLSWAAYTLRFRRQIGVEYSRARGRFACQMSLCFCMAEEVWMDGAAFRAQALELRKEGNNAT
jgi:hypothetical protein